MSDNSNFKQGLKGTSIFGGVGVFNIIINILKSKVLALLLGPAGMGVYGLFASAIDLMNKGTNLGLRTSAVRTISKAYSSGDDAKVSHSIFILKRIILYSGIGGTLLFALLSPVWSKFSFGDYTYSFSFILLSVYLLFIQLYDGHNVIMQGTKHLGDLAKSNIFGGFFSLLVSIPFYFILGIEGIAYAIISTAFVKYVFAYVFTRKINVRTEQLSISQTLKEGREMISLGAFIALQGILLSFSGYVIRAFISRVGGLDDVGLFTSGFYIVNVYTGIVFTAMGTEYYPRLSSLVEDNGLFNKAINDQILLALLLVSPLVCIFLVLGSLGIVILYSSEFLGVTWMVNIAMIGMILKAPGWCMAYAILSKGDSKAYFYSELSSIMLTMFLNVVLYLYWGLNGIGVSFFVSCP